MSTIFEGLNVVQKDIEQQGDFRTDLQILYMNLGVLIALRITDLPPGGIVTPSLEFGIVGVKVGIPLDVMPQISSNGNYVAMYYPGLPNTTNTLYHIANLFIPRQWFLSFKLTNASGVKILAAIFEK